LTKNHSVCLVDQNWYFGINAFLKNEIFFYQSTLSEMSFVDTVKYTKIIPDVEIFNKSKRFLLFNVYYLYTLKFRLTLMVYSEKNLPSIENIYKNSN
jgi:hypothetical protein